MKINITELQMRYPDYIFGKVEYSLKFGIIYLLKNVETGDLYLVCPVDMTGDGENVLLDYICCLTDDEFNSKCIEQTVSMIHPVAKTAHNILEGYDMYHSEHLFTLMGDYV